jgi:replicative DNA helicase
MLRVLFADHEFATTTGVHLTPEHFTTAPMRWLAQKIVGYVKEHGVGISKDALRIELDRDVKIGRLIRSNLEQARALVDAIDTPVKDKSYVKDELFRFIKNQVVDRSIRASLTHLDAMDFESVDKEVQKILDVQQSLDGGLGHFFVRDRKERLKRRKEYVPDGVPTGLFLDELLKPKGVPPKSLTTVVTPTGGGKSGTCLFMCGSAVTSDYAAKALYITTELSAEVVTDRLDARLTGVSLNRLEEERKAVSRSVRDLGVKYGEFLVVKEFPPMALTPNGLRAYLRQLERVAFYPDIVFVDSADDMLPDDLGRDRDSYEDYGSVWRGLRKVSFDIRAPVVTVSQTQRGALNKEHVDWNEIADSAKKAMVSDVIVILQQTRQEYDDKVGRFYVAKNRHGVAKKEWSVRIDWARLNIMTTGRTGRTKK